MSTGETAATREPTGNFANHEKHVQSWYVVGRSKDLRKGKAWLKDFLGRKLAVYRGESGKVFVMEARCSHLGAMLAAGDVVGDCIRCPFHHWKYDGSGKCVDIPYKDTIPARARQLSYPCEERHGLIWMFFGEKPLFEIPNFPEEEGNTPVLRPEMIVRTHPHLILPNSVDINHWSCIHGIRVLQHSPAEALDPYRLRHVVRGELIEPTQTWVQSVYRFFGKKQFEWEWISWGGNVATVDVRRPFRMRFMLTYVPIPGGRTCQARTVLYAPRRNAFLRWTGIAKLMTFRDLVFSLLLFYDDMKVMNTIEFWPHFTKEDAMIAQWVRYVRALPTFDPDAKAGGAPEAAASVAEAEG
jgi:phenylpropionate dioxygenase-like ring-hydroxylating dioxygenase large terminal subunit